jgi:hypothetical protein
MIRVDDRLLCALRKLRAIATDERDLGERLLEVVVAATESTSAALRRPLVGLEEIRVGSDSPPGEVVRLEQRFVARSGVAVLALERPATAPFDDGDAMTLEALGGEVVLRLDQARAEVHASRLRRQIELLRALSHSNEGATPLFDVADRAANELLGAFTGAHVLVHVMGGRRLELVARRTEEGSETADAPDWIRFVPLDGPTLALVRRLADALGGTVIAESRAVGGALFTLTLPVSSIAAERREPLGRLAR